MNSGFSDDRAAPHDAAVDDAVRALRARGLRVTKLEVDGHNPDLLLEDEDYFIDIKTSDDYANLTIELPCFAAWDHLQAEGNKILVLHRDKSKRGWWCDTPRSLTARIIGGPRRPSGTGSNDDWYLIAAGGTPVNEWFGPNPGSRKLSEIADRPKS